MKTLLLKHDYREAAAKLVGQFPDRSHATLTLDADTKVIAPDGIITALLLCNVIPSALHKLAYELWKTVDQLPSNRATAAGAPSLPRLKSDGTLGERRVVPESVLEVLEEQGARQGVLGYLDATADQPCHQTRLSINRPEMLDGNRQLIERVDQLYLQNMPRLHAKQRTEVEKAGPWWRLWNTAFTTTYIAKNFRTAYHTDSGNLPGVMSAIMPMGKFTGGELVLPRWRIAIAYKPGDLLLFDPQQLHGNLPFVGERLSAIFYCERRIADCGKLRA
jgi:hypothetical protein